MSDGLRPSDAGQPLAGAQWRSQGLTSAEAARRLAEYGPNELPARGSGSILASLTDALREPMLLLLVAISATYFTIGAPHEALILSGAVLVVIAISVIQTQRTERALSALRALSSPRALVIRDGEPRRIAGRDVVLGDVVLVAEGDRIPADAAVRSSNALFVNESILTGESVPVSKVAMLGAGPRETPGGDAKPFAYSGTLVTSGLGVLEVTATGPRTEMGAIGQSLEDLRPETTRLQREAAGAVRLFAAIGVAVCVVTAGVYTLTRGSLLQGILTGLTLAIALVPEEVPMVLTIFLAIGAWRIARRNVLTRRMPAIETLGSATVLCVDKTGTLTQNEMAVVRLEIDRVAVTLGPDARGLSRDAGTLLADGARASHDGTIDPVDVAFHHAAKAAGVAAGLEQLLQEYPFSTERMMMGRAWRREDGAITVAVKGAPEAVAQACGLDAGARSDLDARVRDLAADGLRVIAIATAAIPGPAAPVQLGDCRFSFRGLAGLADPVRPGVSEAIATCRDAGIRVVMITGDYPETARAIARAVGLSQPDRAITGSELAGISDDDLRRVAADVQVFARVLPDQKLRLVRALQANRDIVAMTGDGVNDAPALLAADIGVAMGRRGSDVAREAAALVLLDDRFQSIVDAVALGRRIYENIRRALAYVVAVHVPVAGLALIPVALGWPLVLMPVHIVFFELIVDPACSTVFEAEPAGPELMTRPPRDPTARIFDRELVLRGLLQGVGLLLPSLIVFVFALEQGRSEQQARALSFATLVAVNLSLIWISRSNVRFDWSVARLQNLPLWTVTAATLAVLATTLYVPWARTVFQFALPPWNDLALVVAAFLAAGLWLELVKGR